MAKKLKQAANILVSISAWSTRLLATEKRPILLGFPIVVTYTLLGFCHVSIFLPFELVQCVAES